MRKYVSGMKWCVWRWTEVDSEYIRRLHVLKTPWFAICLHWILKPDPEPWLHDHPVTFLSLVLCGGYRELRRRPGRGTQIVPHNWYNWITASDLDQHSIIDVKPKTLTLCFMGPKTREWGFHTTAGWIYWKDYYWVQRRVDAFLEAKQKQKDDRIAMVNRDLADGLLFLRGEE